MKPSGSNESAEVVSLTLGPVGTNCYLVADLAQHEAVVIDPSWDGQHIAGELERREWQLCAILITHAHFDHIGGCAELIARFPAPTYLGQADLPLWTAKGGADLFGVQFTSPPVSPKPLGAGDRIRCGQLLLEVLSLPGHTAGHVGFLERKRGWLFSGDVIFSGSIGRTDLPGGSYPQLLQSIQTGILSLPDDTLIFSGHGPVTTVGQERVGNPFLV
ncbi:MAG: MBL fold metallo-hydrolase [Anaerolineales bacterium]|jgi:glyoxylase-like metal-dependent hydrolase (beta-lactamase superfamily II)